MKTFTIGQLEIDVLRHVRVDGSRFPTPDPDSIADYFMVNARYAGVPIDFYPNEGRRVDPLAFGFIGKKLRPKYQLASGSRGTGDAVYEQVGFERGGDFRTRLWPLISRRLAKAVLGRQLGKTISQLTQADEDAAGLAVRRLLRGQLTPPADMRLMTIDDAARFLRDADGVLEEGEKPPGTVVNIDVDYDGDINSTGATKTTTGTENYITNNFAGSNIYRTFNRFPLSSIPAGATINSVDYQVNITVTSADAGEGLEVHAYGASEDGAGDPSGDTGTTLYDNCDKGGTNLNTIVCEGATGSYSVSLGATGVTQVGTCLSSPGTYSIGLSSLGLDASGSDAVRTEADDNAGTDPATLTVDYTSGSISRTASPILVDTTLVTAAKLLTIAASPILVELASIAPAKLLSRQASVISVQTSAVTPARALAAGAAVISVDVASVAPAELLTAPAIAMVVQATSVAPAEALNQAAAVMSVDVASVAPAELLTAPASVVSVPVTSVPVTTTAEHSRSASPILVDATLVTVAKALAAVATPITVDAASVSPTLLLAAGASPILVQAAIVAAEKALTAAAAVIQVQALPKDVVAFTGFLRTASPISVQAASVAPALALSSQATPIAVEAALVAVSEALAASASAISVQAASVAPERLLTASAAVIAVQATPVTPAELLTLAAAVIGVDVASVAADPAVAIAAAAILVEAGLVSQDLALAYQAAVVNVEATMVPASYRTGGTQLATPILVEVTFVAASHLRWWERVTAELKGLDRSTIRAKGSDRASIQAEGRDHETLRFTGEEP